MFVADGQQRLTTLTLLFKSEIRAGNAFFLGRENARLTVPRLARPDNR